LATGNESRILKEKPVFIEEYEEIGLGNGNENGRHEFHKLTRKDLEQKYTKE
jgi:hypothetical protein